MATNSQHLAIEDILDAFQHWAYIPELSTFADVNHLINTYERQSGPTHYFDRDAIRFFGSRNLHMHRRGLMIETQTSAPDGVGRYKLTAWVYDIDAAADHRGGPRLTPQTFDRFFTLCDARRAAEQVADAWAAAIACKRLRVAGAPGSAEELLAAADALAMA